MALEIFTAVRLQVAAQTGTKGKGIKITILTRMINKSAAAAAAC